MRVYFCGAHSVGKSTLARYVSEKYKLALLTEVARMVLSERELQIDSLRADIDLVNNYQSQVFHRQILEEKKYESFVSDRSLIDCLVYSLQHSRVGAELASDTMFKHYIEALKDQIVFFVRPSKATLKNDGVREAVSWDSVISIDAQIKLLLEMYNVRFFNINTDSMQERTRFIDSILSLAIK